MLFMDYRTDYVDKSELSEEESKELDGIPTFLYAMPMGEAPNGRRRIFFEEVRDAWVIDPPGYTAIGLFISLSYSYDFTVLYYRPQGISISGAVFVFDMVLF